GIMRTGRVWHRAQLIVTRGSFVAGAFEVGSSRGWPYSDATRLRHARTFRIPTTPDTPEHPGSRRPGSDTPEHSGSRRPRHARTSRVTTTRPRHARTCRRPTTWRRSGVAF